MKEKIKKAHSKFDLKAQETNLYSFANYIEDDFEAEIYASLQHRNNNHLFSNPIIFISSFRQLLKREKIKKDFKEFIDEFSHAVQYIENCSSLKGVEFWLLSYCKWMDWLVINRMEKIAQDFEGSILNTKQHYNKAKQYVLAYFNYLDSVEDIEEANYRTFEKPNVAEVFEINLPNRIAFAKDAIQFLSGKDPSTNSDYFSKDDFALIEKFTIELISRDDCPPAIPLIKCPYKSGATIRFTYFNIHKYCFGKTKKDFFFVFLVQMFSCFNTYRLKVLSGEFRKTKLYKDFSVAPNTYHPRKHHYIFPRK